jgi:hypothetical protein
MSVWHIFVPTTTPRSRGTSARRRVRDQRLPVNARGDAGRIARTAFARVNAGLDVDDVRLDEGT